MILSSDFQRILLVLMLTYWTKVKNIIENKVENIIFNININTTATVLVTIEFMISYSCSNIFQKIFELYVTTSCSLSESVKPFFCCCQFAAVLLLQFVIYEFISILRFAIHFFQQFIITKFHIYWHN